MSKSTRLRRSSSPGPSPGGSGTPTKPGRTTNKMNNTKYRGIVSRPLASSITRAEEEYKLFVTSVDDIDHNLYGRFLGVLKDAGIPWKTKKLPEAREDALHTMNALVLAINAYQHYQNDVVSAYAEIESSVSQSRSHSHSQATDVSKLQNELAVLRKEFAAQTSTLAKESAASKDAMAHVKRKLQQTERDCNDATIQIQRLKRELEEEKKHSKALTAQMAVADKPKFGRTTPGTPPKGGRPRSTSHTGGRTTPRARTTTPTSRTPANSTPSEAMTNSPFPWTQGTPECAGLVEPPALARNELPNDTPPPSATPPAADPSPINNADPVPAPIKTSLQCTSPRSTSPSPSKKSKGSKSDRKVKGSKKAVAFEWEGQKGVRESKQHVMVSNVETLEKKAKESESMPLAEVAEETKPSTLKKMWAKIKGPSKAKAVAVPTLGGGGQNLTEDLTLQS